MKIQQQLFFHSPFWLALAVGCSLQLPSLAQALPAGNYASSLILDSLRKGANSVIRLFQQDLEVKSPGKAVLSNHTVITLLNDKASDNLKFSLIYDKFIKVEDARVDLYDSTGKLISRYKKKDMQDLAATDDETLAGDVRYLYLELGATSYPLTMDVQTEVTMDAMVNYPQWDILDPDQSLQLGVYTIEMPPGVQLRYQSQHINLTPSISNSGDNKVYEWTVQGLTARKEEDNSMASEYQFPRLMVAPDQFDYDDNPGNQDSWSGLGAWAFTLFNQPENTLPDDRQQQIRSMVAGSTTDEQKIAILYHYLQNNVRYVSIQLGIGGYKPFSASFVDQRKYGDCKALCNYMHELLKIVNINSYPGLVNAGPNEAPVDPAFPENEFNHVILCVPLKADTIWLDCTDNIGGVGVLGAFTENRYALLLTEKGGVLVHTPKSLCSENRIQTSTTIHLNQEGDGNSTTTINSTGDFGLEFYGLVKDEKTDDQKEFFVHDLRYKEPNDFTVNSMDNNDGDFLIHLQMSFEKVPEFSAGPRLFLLPRLYPLNIPGFQPDTSRTEDYFLEFPFEKTDTTIYVLPAGYHVDNLPDPSSYSFSDGIYQSNYAYDESKNEVIATASLVLKTNRIPAGQYQNMSKFYREVEKDNRQRIVVMKPD